MTETNDWPADPENEELGKLAQELKAAVAPLSPEALSRIERQMKAELDRAAWRGRWRRIAFGWSIAAGIVVAMSAYFFFRNETEQLPLAKAVAPAIEDHIHVAIGPAGTLPTNQKPLIRLDEYRSLFVD